MELYDLDDFLDSSSIENSRQKHMLQIEAGRHFGVQLSDDFIVTINRLIVA
jgi:hypothetical protein